MTRLRRALVTGGPWVVALALGILAAATLASRDQASTAKDKASTAQSQVQTVKTQAAQARTTAAQAQQRSDEQTRTLRRTVVAYRVLYRWVRGQRGIDGQRGRPGRPGANAPPVTDAQLDARFQAFCAGRGGCAGPAPTTAQILSAAAQVCATGTCGAATDQQVAAAIANQIDPAVDAYCDAHDGCRGPAGKDGSDGKDGTAGVGYDCTGTAVPPGGTPATCPGQIVTVTETVIAPPPPADPAAPAAP